MHFTNITTLPARHHKRKGERTNMLEELNFVMELGYKHCKAESLDGDYHNPISTYCGLRAAIERYKFPLTVELINGEVYITRNDI